MTCLKSYFMAEYRLHNLVLDGCMKKEQERGTNHAIRHHAVIIQALTAVTIDHYVSSEAALIAESVRTHASKGDVERLLADAAEQRYKEKIVPVLANEMGYVSSSDLSQSLSQLSLDQLKYFKLTRLPEPDKKVREHLDGTIGNFKRPYFFRPEQVQDILNSSDAVAVREAYVLGVVKEAKNLLGMISETKH